jgi:hypothetical protein
MGIRYLWIDALCIIQDDGTDKHKEIPELAKVYRNATVVIGAARARSAGQGFLGPRMPLPENQPQLTFSVKCFDRLGRGNCIPSPKVKTEPSTD